VSYRVALNSPFTSPQPGTSSHSNTTGMMYLFAPQLSLVLIAPTNRGMARLS